LEKLSENGGKVKGIEMKKEQVNHLLLLDLNTLLLMT